jgi:HAD superfamily hydrolase (TIGR01549 family)
MTKRRGPARPARARPSVRAVLFDLDDTVFDHTATAIIALGALRGSTPELLQSPLAEVARRYGELLDEIFPSVLAGRSTMEAARVERFARLCEWAGRPVSPSRARELSDSYRSSYQLARRAVPGITDLLERLPPGLVVGIVSNNQQDEQLDKLRALGLEGKFDFVLTSERAGFAKPDPRIFRAALSEAGTGAEETVMVGDSWLHDVVGALDSGIRPLWFNRWGRVPPEPRGVDEVRSWRPPASVVRQLTTPAGSTKRPATQPGGRTAVARKNA